MKKLHCLSAAEVIRLLEQKCDLFKTQKELAKEIGIDQSTLCQMLKGARPMCRKTSAYLGIEPFKITVYIEV